MSNLFAIKNHKPTNTCQWLNCLCDIIQSPQLIWPHTCTFSPTMTFKMSTDFNLIVPIQTFRLLPPFLMPPQNNLTSTLAEKSQSWSWNSMCLLVGDKLKKSSKLQGAKNNGWVRRLGQWLNVPTQGWRYMYSVAQTGVERSFSLMTSGADPHPRV